MTSLSSFLKSHGFQQKNSKRSENDGYISPSQKEQFSNELQKHPHIKRIAEIGFNGGHSAEHFFKECQNLEVFFAFDINTYPCTRYAVHYFYQMYINRFLFIPGDSLTTVPEIHQKFPHLSFDLIYIDGCHLFEWALGDLMNARKIAHSKTLIWVDDVDPDLQNGVGAAIKLCETFGYFKIELFFSSNDPECGERHWVQLRQS